MVAPALQVRDPDTALRRGTRALVGMQKHDGSWEGECVWCAMLTAQYAITAHAIGLDVSAERMRGILTHFRATQNRTGLWGLHPYDRGSLFVTTLVYVAARLLGALPTEPWLRDARRMFEQEGGVQRIPTWGKVWLAFLDLYSWEGVNPILPEAWSLPTWVPLHPSNYYCHTRSIYLGLAVLYGQRFVAKRTPITDELRRELYPSGYETIDFEAHASDVREEDAPFPTGRILRAIFGAAHQVEVLGSSELRGKLLDALRDTMRRDLRASDYLSLSPVNGLLTMLALFADDPKSADLGRAIDRFDAWFWEDAREGSRVAGAGSVCWDTSFAIQTLSAAGYTGSMYSTAIEKGASFLATQQVERAEFDYRRVYRIDPSGGWCFSEVGHGWPVSDCTAEAMLALLYARPRGVEREQAARAVRFILRCQNRDGGFGSYEPRKTRWSLEWMNPAEMFGKCMTERSYVECTASCLLALVEVQKRYPDLLRRPIGDAVERATRFLVSAQHADGTWDAAWGVWYIYSTMFGVRGLRAAGVPTDDERIRRACRWLLAHQRSDGAWGERQPRASRPGFAASATGSAVQTAWALIALAEAEEPDTNALDRAASWLEDAQLESGEWPDGEFVGVFFETALLNYRLYRQYFPVLALALYERRRTGSLK
jgi:lanosterol synthase